MKMTLAPDIIERISSDFPTELVAEVIEILENAVFGISIVGTDQLARSLLFLCKGDINALKKELLPEKKMDPRNIVMWADIEAGGQDHCFGLTFDEIANLEIIDHEKGIRDYCDEMIKDDELSKFIDWSIPPIGEDKTF